MRRISLFFALAALVACVPEADPDPDNDGFVNAEDCGPYDPDINPEAAEVCNGKDDNCDGSVDEGLGQAWYADVDGDGFGADATAVEACEAPLNHVAMGGDCDDDDARYNPAAPETDCADPEDYNCDGSVGYADEDGDGFAACEECDDSAADVNPEVAEICNDRDDNCDGVVDLDADDRGRWYLDFDGDGYGNTRIFQDACEAPAGHVADATDCDDASALSYPGAEERCDGLDNDCDGTLPIDETDEDGDGFRICGGDCDDDAATIFPGAAEVCNDADDDCDSIVDNEGARGSVAWYTDSDGDGFGLVSALTLACTQPTSTSTVPGDCDDTDDDISPAADELCDEGRVDEDCDGRINEPGAIDAGTWYTDGDGDGFGGGSGTRACEAPTGTVSTAGDCDDSDEDIYPGADEYCNSADDDCDGTTDEASALDATDWFRDGDGDGYGATSSRVSACSAPSRHVEDDGDCNDGNSSIYPGATESCNGTDADCDGLVGEDELLGTLSTCPGEDCADIDDARSGTSDGSYWIAPGSSSPFQAYCDMTTAPGGWTRVSTIPLASSSGCTIGSGAKGDPASGSGCTKYSDSVINDLGQEQVFFADVAGQRPTFTHYSGSISFSGRPTRVIQGGSYADVASKTPSFTPGYSAWRFFHQENWYQSDRCLGSPSGHVRLSLEYIVDTGNLYGCTGGCGSNCPTYVRGQTALVYIR